MPLKYLCIRFSIVFLLVVGLLVVMAMALAYFFGVGMPSGASVVTMISPAFDAGHVFVRKTKRPLRNGEAWLLSAVFTVLNCLIGAILFSVVLGVVGGPQELAGILDEVDPGVVAMIFLAALGLCFLVTRVSIGFGAKAAFNAFEKQA